MRHYAFVVRPFARLSCAFAVLLFARILPAQTAQTSAASAPEPARPPTNAERTEATAHFRRGVTHTQHQDFAAALAEFQAAYRIGRNPLVLFNISAVYEALHRYSDALDALERLQQSASARELAPLQRTLTQAFERLRMNVGVLRVTLEHRGLTVTVDGAEVPMSTMRAGLRVSVGLRRVALRAPGREGREQEIDVAGGVTVTIDRPLEARMSTILIESNVADAEVRVDGTVVGHTPMSDPIRVEEGEHRVEIERPGYTSHAETVRAEGLGARVNGQLEWLLPQQPIVGAALAVRTNVRGVVALLDGQRIPVDGSARVPPGAHQLRVEREDYLPSVVPITLAPGVLRTLDIRLEPTPAFRDRYLADAQARHTTAYVFGGSGVATFVASGALFISQMVELDPAQRALTAQENACRMVMSPRPMNDPTSFQSCTQIERDRLSRVQVFATTTGVLVGVGLAGTIVGAVLYAMAPRLDRFDRPPVFQIGFGPGSVAGRLQF